MEFAKYYSVSYKAVTVYYSWLGIECLYGRPMWIMPSISSSHINLVFHHFDFNRNISSNLSIQTRLLANQGMDNKTERSLIRSEIIRVLDKIGRPCGLSPIC